MCSAQIALSLEGNHRRSMDQNLHNWSRKPWLHRQVSEWADHVLVADQQHALIGLSLQAMLASSW